MKISKTLKRAKKRKAQRQDSSCLDLVAVLWLEITRRHVKIDKPLRRKISMSSITCATKRGGSIR